MLVEVEGVVNARPITYVFDDSEGVSYALTPSQLINGRNLSQEPSARHSEIVSNYETLSKRARYHRKLLENFSQQWRKDYLLSLMEAYKSKQVTQQPALAVGDIVILKDYQTKRAFWKLCRILEVIPGKDGNVRAAKVEVASVKGKKVFRRPLQHLIPLEIPRNTNDLLPRVAQAQSSDKPAASTEAQASSRPKRNAAIIGTLRRKELIK